MRKIGAKQERKTRDQAAHRSWAPGWLGAYLEDGRSLNDMPTMIAAIALILRGAGSVPAAGTRGATGAGLTVSE